MLRRWLVALIGVTVVAATGALADTHGETRAAERARATRPSVQGRLAVTVKRAGASLIAVRGLTGGPVRLLSLQPSGAKAVEVESLAWSPKADRLAYSDSAGRVYVVGASGAGLRLVAEPAQGVEGRRVSVRGWSPDGRSLAIDSSARRCPSALEPRLFVLEVAPESSLRELPAHPTGAPAASLEDSAYIASVQWSPGGSQLLYTWEQYRDGGCRTMGGEDRPTRVMRIGVDGANRVQVAQRRILFDVAWSPSGRSIALARGCGGARTPLAWTRDERSIIIATIFDGCAVSARKSLGGDAREAVLTPSRAFKAGSPGAVLYAVNVTSARARVLKKFAVGTEFVAIGVAPRGAGLIALREWNGNARGLVVILLDGSALRPLAPLKLAAGMTLRLDLPAAAGFTH